VLRIDAMCWIPIPFSTDVLPVCVEAEGVRWLTRKTFHKVLLSQHHRHPGILEDERKALLWIGRIEGDISTAGLQDSQ
jgi:hypothetical protein